MNVFEQIHQEAELLAPQLRAQRRDFHKYAESAWLEMRTSSIIARKLTDLGYEVLTGAQVCKPESQVGLPAPEVLEEAYQRALEQGADREFAAHCRTGLTGVIGILRCGEGPTVAMRFDIDALGVIESEDPEHFPVQEGFASVNYGTMHACGHDGHATIGLGVAQVLMTLREQLHGTVKLIFQPSEEALQGAKPIVDNGHLEGVQYMLGAHISTLDKKERDAVVTPGCYGSLACAKYDVVYTGQSAHAGGTPHKGKNALLAAATAVTNLYAIPRHGRGATRINVGTLVAGTGRNVIADIAKMELEIRGATGNILEYMRTYALDILEHCAQMYGCTCQMVPVGDSVSMVSSPELCQRIDRVCREDLKIPVTTELTSKSGGSEDVSYMVNRVQEQGGQGVFMRLRTPCVGMQHARQYDFDEGVLVNGVKVFCAMVYDLLK